MAQSVLSLLSEFMVRRKKHDSSTAFKGLTNTKSGIWKSILHQNILAPTAIYIAKYSFVFSLKRSLLHNSVFKKRILLKPA